jgi:tetratricopeptide (TPR) repeat protein
MSIKPGKIALFWQELKRRKVIKAATMYAATAFIITEASDIVLPRLGLPDWTVTFLIILLIVGFPIAMILSWIFDVTPQGVEKTESIEEESQSTKLQKKKSLFNVSNLIITILLVVVCFLLYPRIFSKDQFEGIRDEKGRISVAVMPFENLTGDSLNNVWQGGIQNLLISALSNSSEIQVRRYQTMTSILSQKKDINQASVSPSLAGELARNLETKTYILGKIMQAGNRIRINAQLLDAETEEIYKTFQVDCLVEGDVFAVSDSLGGMIRNFLEIKKYSESIRSPGTISSLATNSAEAFGYYIHAYESFEKQDVRTTTELLQRAIEADPDFIDAYVFLSIFLTSIPDYQLSEDVLSQVYPRREQVSPRERLYLDHLYAYHHETPVEEIIYCRQILELDEMNPSYWILFGYAHSKIEQYEDAIVAFEKAVEIYKKWEINISIPHLYQWMGTVLHEVGDHKRENEIFDLGLKAMPNHAYLLHLKAQCALSRGEIEEAAALIQSYKSQREAEGWSEGGILNSVGYMHEHAGLIEEAEKIKRQAYASDPDEPQVLEGLAWVLIEYDINVQEAMPLIEKAVELDSGAYNIMDTWGWGLYKSGQYEEALAALKKAQELRGLYDPMIEEQIRTVEKALAESER